MTVLELRVGRSTSIDVSVALKQLKNYTPMSGEFSDSDDSFQVKVSHFS